MRNALTQRITRSRPRGWIAPVVAVMALGVALPASVVLGRVEPLSAQPAAAAMSPDTVAIVTGGGTVIVTEGTMNVVASFGLNARRPDGFTGGGIASGRVNYDEHANVASRHVNAPVALMQAAMSGSPTPNGTGGSAAMSADCTPPAECPSGFNSVIVYVEDNADSGATFDVFKIFFCTFGPFLPGPTFNGSTAPASCIGPEGNTLRTGNIQVRQTITGSSASVPTAARAPLRLP
ncbi:MAG: hypothetical protein E6H89_06675 [Chloroflexi bacterium]|nr:MAG: hypothetical protein E6I49_02845 [Chloroflexota bacterium]TMG52240.1 MAG: hypothetical protein E6H89_06675 [Chloroflexota bacterium]